MLDSVGIGDVEYQLRNVDEKIFKSNGPLLPEALYKRAAHYFGEMNRVQDGIDAWEQGVIKRFGSLMTASGESSKLCSFIYMSVVVHN